MTEIILPGEVPLSLLWPALWASALVIATHLPLGAQVLARGIIFIDLAIAQIAGCGVLLADRFGFEAEGIAVLVSLFRQFHTAAQFVDYLKRFNPQVEFIGEAWPKLFQPDYTEVVTKLLNAKADGQTEADRRENVLAAWAGVALADAYWIFVLGQHMPTV